MFRALRRWRPSSWCLSPNASALYQLMRPNLLRYRWRLITVLLLLPVSAATAALIPYLTKVALDDYVVPAMEAGSMAGFYEPLVSIVGLAMGVVVLGYLTDAFYVQLLQRTGQRLIAELREAMYARTLKLPRSYFDRHPIGSILTRVTSDVEALGESLAGNVLSLILDLLKTIAFVAMMFVLSWQLTLALMVMAPLLIALILFFQVRVRRSFFRARQALSDATGYLQECLNGIKTVQLYAAEKRAYAVFREKNRRFYSAQNASNIYDALLYSLVDGLTSLTLAFILWVAAGQLLLGTLTIGVLVAFIEYIQRLFVPVRELSQQLAVLQRAFAAIDHISELCAVELDAAEEPIDRQELVSASGFEFESLEFKDVHFRYLADGPDILRGVSFEVIKGDTVALVGGTGSGKSTIIKLLARAYGGYRGSILLNGRELTEYGADELGALVSLVHQGVYLFSGSVAFNISLGRDAVDDEAMRAAAGYVWADQFVQELPAGYDHELKGGGSNLSAGQAQLISFARAVAAQTELIVLDEATSSVDSMTEQLIEEALSKLYRARTVIAIAHRLSTIRNADQILVMDAGRIVERGNHETLLAKQGAYAALVAGNSRETLEARDLPASPPTFPPPSFSP
ncbi:MAG: ABC transporter ATP-binding protein [Pseudomonadota bacterium]